MIHFARKSGLLNAKMPLARPVRGTLFWKYVTLFVAMMGLALIANSLIDIWFTYREIRAALVRVQEEQAVSAAAKISQFIKEIEGQLGWMTHLSWEIPAPGQRELDGLRLLRQVPAITELAQIDHHGREQLHLSRLATDRVGENIDYSTDERFLVAMARKVYYGPIYFRRGTEPYMTLAISGSRRDTGVSVAEVNLTHIWDVIHQIRVGQGGQAYVVDAQDRLIAHPDISLVLRKTDMSQLAQVRAARTGEIGGVLMARNLRGERVLSTHATAEPMNWRVFVDLPEDEATAPLYAATLRSVVIVLTGLMLALFAALILARKVVIPIQTLTASAERIGSGALDHRIVITTGDELQTLGEQFNRMATQLEGSYATLERKVAERTHQLEAANQSKSRFLAVASHDLRQPLHALNLFVGQLRADAGKDERERLVTRIDQAAANMNALFNALLDVSKLDAGALEVNLSDFPIQRVLRDVEDTFMTAASAKGLRLRVVASTAWVTSDPILLERILLNLVSNAVRYTSKGGVVVGCRHNGAELRIDVCDSGPGISEDQQRNVFAEFYRIGSSQREHGEGLGLGLAIVERLGALLGHTVAITSKPGVGSRFSVSLPITAVRKVLVEDNVQGRPIGDPMNDRLVVVIDDDDLILDGTAGLLRGWNCRVVTAVSDRDALACLGRDVPDLIISDFHLSSGHNGIAAIVALEKAFGVKIPALLISGDTSPDLRAEARTSGYQFLHKPVSPMALRAVTLGLLRGRLQV